MHAKFYANEFSSISTSMNLYDYSQNNNIEVGVMTEYNPLGVISSSLDLHKTYDSEQTKYFNEVILNSQLKFKNEPVLDGILFKKLISIDNKIDQLTPLFGKEKTETKTIIDAKFFSVTALSKEIGISSKDLLSKFEQMKFITKNNNEWELTHAGKNKGAQIKKGQYGEYIAWPETIRDIL